MRVDAYNSINQIYQATTKTKPKATSKTSTKDAVFISSTGMDYQIAKQAVASAPDIREDKVADLRSRIQNGSYQVSPSSFAEKLLAKYEEYMG